MGIRRVFEWLYPPLGFFRARHEISSAREEPAVQGVAGSEVAGALVDSIYDSETQRRQRLEDKLGSLFGYVSLLIPLALASLGFGLRHREVLPCVLSVLALAYLAPVVGLVMEGSRARRVEVVFTDTLMELDDLAEREKIDHVRKAKLEAVQKNLPLSWNLNNALSAARDSLVWGLILVSLSVGLTLARGAAVTGPRTNHPNTHERLAPSVSPTR